MPISILYGYAVSNGGITVKQHPARHLIVATLVLSLSTPAFGAARARNGDVDPACAGLASPVKHKNLGKNLPARKKESNQFCGDPAKSVLAGKVGQHLKRITDASKKCETALKRTVSPNFSIENLVKKPADRLLNACIQVRAYNSFSGKLCADYGTNSQKTKNMGGIATDEVNARNSFEAIARMHDPLAAAYKKMASDSESEAKDIEKRMAGIKDGKDKVMNDEVDFIKKAVKFNYESAKKLAAAKLPQRRQLSGEGQGMSEVGTLRFKNQREITEFYTALDSCNALAKDGGLLDKWRDEYNKVVAKEIGEMKQEATAFNSFFSDASAEHQRAAAELRGKAGNMNVATLGGELTPAQSDRAIRDGQAWRPRVGQSMQEYLDSYKMKPSGSFTRNGVEYTTYSGPGRFGSGTRTIAIPSERVR